MKPTLVILAAGMGSRYGGLKQIDGMGPHGEAIIDYSIYDAIKAGFGKIVFVIRKEFEDAFRAKFGHVADRVEVVYVFQDINPKIPGVAYDERTKPRGTGHAILSAKEAVDEPFVVISADDYYGSHAFELAAQATIDLVDETTSVTFCYKLGNTLSDFGSVNRGVCEVEDGLLVVSKETLQIEPFSGGIRYPQGEGWVSLSTETPVAMLMYGVHPSIFEVLESSFIDFASQHYTNLRSEFHFPNVLGSGIADGSHQSKVVVSDERWSGVSYKEDKELVQKRLEELSSTGRYPSPLWD